MTNEFTEELEMVNTFGSELRGLKQDIKVGEREVIREQQNFANSLKNGLGEAMINHLENPPKPNYWTALKIKWNRWKSNKKSRN